MSDVFISYARQDRDRAEKLARAIEQRGFSVWWDRKIPPGRTFDEVIQESLAGASCSLVLWSHHSVKSDFVKDEAQRAADRGRLIPILVDEVPIPLGFGRIQTADLAGWREGEFHPQLEYVLESIAVFSGRGLVAEERTGFRVLPPLGPPPAEGSGFRPVEAYGGEPDPPPESPPVSARKRPRFYAALSVSIAVVSILVGAVVATYLLGAYPTVSAAGVGADPPLVATLASAPASQLEPEGPAPAEPEVGPAPVEESEPEVGPAPVEESEPEVGPGPVEEPEPGPTPAELKLEAIERYLNLRKAESDPEVDDRELLADYRDLWTTHGELLSAEQAETLSERVATLEATLEAFEKVRELDESGRATIGEKLAGWQEFVPARSVGPIASQVGKRLEDLEQSASGAATIASAEDFVTCRNVQDLQPYGQNSRFRPGKVFVFARIRAPRNREQLTFEWLSDDGTVVRTKSVAISRSLAGYRIFDVHSFGETGVNEVRLYNSDGDLIGRTSFEVRAVGS